MIEFTVETEIARPPAAVFAYATDPALLPTWQVNTVSAVPEPAGPLRVGTRLREVHRGPGGRELASLVEVVEHEPDRRFALRIVEGPLPVDARLALEPRADGTATALAFIAHGRARGPLRLIEPLLARTLRKQFTADCARLKERLEASP